MVARWELSRRLATRRKELGIDVKSVTDALGFTRNYWSAVENDRTLIAEDKLRLLFDLFDFSDQDQSELLTLREDSRKRGWWDEYPSLSDDHKRFYGMEAGAVRIRTYGGHLIPGVLQTSAYTRAVIATDPGLSPVDLDRFAELRRRRQQHLFESSRPHLTVMLSEAALHQQVAGPEVQAEQLQSLCDRTEDDTSAVTVHLLSFRVNPGAIINSTTLSFVEYEGAHLPTTAWQEGVQLFGDLDADEDDEEFRRLEIAWDHAMGQSLDVDESVVAMRRVIEELVRTG
ncbi:MAG: Scr1 family TA system antitoxin-like transcriptional regulator [Actinomycetota bacterium]